MRIEMLTPDNCKLASYLGDQFSKASKNLHGYDSEIAIKTYTQLLTSGVAVGIGMFIENDLAGILIAAKVPSLYSRHIIAQELVWYVDEKHRGKGILLLKAFMAWAKNENCTLVSLAHMADSMPDKLKNLYKRMGFVENETHYIKEI